MDVGIHFIRDRPLQSIALVNSFAIICLNSVMLTFLFN